MFLLMILIQIQSVSAINVFHVWQAILGVKNDYEALLIGITIKYLNSFPTQHCPGTSTFFDMKWFFSIFFPYFLKAEKLLKSVGFSFFFYYYDYSFPREAILLSILYFQTYYFLQCFTDNLLFECLIVLCTWQTVDQIRRQLWIVKIFS